MTVCRRVATSSSAASQLTRSAAAPRVGRRMGCNSRAVALIMGDAVRCSVLPLLHRRPKLAGWSGSPRTPVIAAPSDSMITPQPTPQ